MNIETEEQAREAINAVAKFLAESDLDWPDEKAWRREYHWYPAWLARDLTYHLLEEVGVDDMGGCPLCCG